MGVHVEFTALCNKVKNALMNSRIQATFYSAALLFIIKSSKQHGWVYAESQDRTGRGAINVEQ